MASPTFFFIKKKKIKKNGREKSKRPPPEPKIQPRSSQAMEDPPRNAPACAPAPAPGKGGHPPPDRAGEDHAPPQPPALDQVQCSGAGKPSPHPFSNASSPFWFICHFFPPSHYFCPIPLIPWHLLEFTFQIFFFLYIYFNFFFFF